MEKKLRQQVAKPQRIVSTVCEDGTLVELVLREGEKDTALVVCRESNAEVQAHWDHDGIRYIPVPVQHNLIKHGALKLPGLPLEYGDAAELQESIERYVTRYVDLSAAFTKIATTYVLLSWVYDAFAELPYLRFRGDYGSGKTRALIVVGSILYRPFFASGASTVSPIFHTLDTFKGSMVFDEADFRFTDEKAELVKILNNGNAKGFPVLRTHVTPMKDFEPRAFSVFGPKIVAMRGSYEDRALESRFFTEEMSGRSLRADIPISLPDAQEEDAAELRSKLLMFRLRERSRVSIDSAVLDSSLEPRMNQVMGPLLSVAATEEARRAILDYARSSHAGIVSDRSASPEGQLLAIVYEMVNERDAVSLPLGDLVSAFFAKHGGEYERPITPRFLGSILRTKLGLPLYKTNGIVALSLQNRERLIQLFARYGVGDSEGKSGG